MKLTTDLIFYTLSIFFFIDFFLYIKKKERKMEIVSSVKFEGKTFKI